MANKKVTDLAKWRATMLDEMGGDGYPFELTWEDGDDVHEETFTVPHPMGMNAVQNEKVDDAVGNVALAKALLNTEDDDEVYDRFVAAGGQAGDIVMAYRSMAREMNAPK